METSSTSTKAALLEPGMLRRYLELTGREILSNNQLRCPNAAAGHKHGDAHPSAHLYEGDGHDHVSCFGSCGTWDIFDLYGFDHGLDVRNADADFKRALQELADMLGVSTLQAPDANQVKTATRSTPPTNDAKPARAEADTAYLRECAARIEEAAGYLRTRGISVATARRLGCGYDPDYYFKSEHRKMAGVIFPATGKWAARSLEGKCHDYAAGSKGSAFNVNALWNTEPVQAVYLVEGQFDALAIEECGGHAVALGGYGKTEVVDIVRERMPSAPLIVAFDHETNPDLAASVIDASRRLADKLRAAGAFVYNPGTDNVFDAHDADDALKADREKFALRIRALDANASECYMLRDEPAATNDESGCIYAPYLFTANEIPPPIPEEENPRSLFRNGFLRKSQVLTIFSCAGVGKSVISNQCAIAWAKGRKDILGIEPIRPLKTLVVQYEDDMEELSDFFVDYRRGYGREGWTDADLVDAFDRLTYINTRKLRIEKRINLVDDSLVEAIADIQRHFHFDIVVLNPLTSTVSETDLSDNFETNAFLRQRLEPIIEDPATECGLVLIHHTNKLPPRRDRAEMAKNPALAQYEAAGAASLMNFTRASLMIWPTEVPTAFELIGAKRGGRLGWKDDAGKKTNHRLISYSPDIKFWIPTPEDEAAEVREAAAASRGSHDTTPKMTPEEMAKKLAAALNALKEPVASTFARREITKQVGLTGLDAAQAFDMVMEHPEKYGVRFVKEGKFKYMGGPFNAAGNVDQGTTVEEELTF